MIRFGLSAVCALVLGFAFAPPAQAAFGLNNFNFIVEDRDGNVIAQPQAGSHPVAVTTTFGLNYTGTNAQAMPEGEPRDIVVQLPPGFAGAPSAVSTCVRADFLRINPNTNRPDCPDETAVGVINAKVFNPDEPPAPRAVFNLAPPPGVAAEFGFLVANAPIMLDFYVRQSPPYNVVAKITYASQAAKLFGSELTIWGDPYDPIHDPERGNCVAGETTGCSVDLPRKAFVTLPRACQGPQFVSYEALSWQGVFDSGLSQDPLEVDGCENLDFGPTIAAEPSTGAAESPSGLSFELNIEDPELTDPSETATADSDIKKVVVKLPEGVTTNPAIASGLGACTAAQLASETIDSAPGTGCPESSKIGSVEAETPLLEGTVFPGSVYVAKQGDNGFGNLLTIFMVVKDPQRGVLVRLPGRVDPDPVTGQLTTTFDDLPQLPLSHVRLNLQRGPRGALITPSTCGSYTTEADLYPWAGGPPVHQTATFQVDSGAGGTACVDRADRLPNAPRFAAGTLNSKAGSFSPFVLQLERPDGSQQLKQIATTLPTGLVAKLAGVPYCPEAGLALAAARGGEGQGAAELASPSCPDAAQIGTVTVGAGAGPEPLQVQGRVYLAGPYKGAPLSLAIVTPALAGPFDLGVVAVRTPLQVNPFSAQITAVSDPLPTILHGLPLDIRSIDLRIDRPGFTVNPTSCEPKAITGTATSVFDAVSPLSQYFQAGQCRALSFSPKLKLKLKGETKRGGNPALQAVLTQPPGQSGIAAVTTILPKTEFIDNAHISNPCTRVQFAAGTCPKGSILGRAKAWSPLLDQPLQGPVYFRSNGGERELPDLVAVLDGQIQVELVGFIDSVKAKGSSSRIRTRFLGVPDAPVSKFTLNLAGGKRGLLDNSVNLCRARNRATIQFVGQNGMRSLQKSKLKVSCRR